eukprot:7293121-Alexandrium_andersonii.AAC.1
MAWSHEVWEAVARPSGSHFSARQLSGFRGDCKPKVQPYWSQSRGPVNGVILALQHIGWKTP